jgi:hypothetical protein
VAAGDADFILYLDAKLSDSFDADFFVVLFTAINSKQQIGDQAGEYLNHEAILASGNQMVDFEMAFPPGKELLYVPSEFVNEGNLLS